MWADYTPEGSDKDHHYLTSSLRGVQINEDKEYLPGANSRKAFAHKVQVVVEEKPVTEKYVEMPLALAMYQIVALDVERYKGFIAANNNPEIEDLMATIIYEGFFPNSYDVHRNEPNGASRTIKYTGPLTDITDSTLTIGRDYIFANDVNSFISATVSLSEKSTDVVITQMSNVRIDNLRGHLTTVEFDYLTAGVVGEGVSIDTRWEGVFDVYF